MLGASNPGGERPGGHRIKAGKGRAAKSPGKNSRYTVGGKGATPPRERKHERNAHFVRQRSANWRGEEKNARSKFENPQAARIQESQEAEKPKVNGP